MMVTLLPKLEKIVANSKPITPPPIMVSDLGNSLMLIRRLLLTTEGSEISTKPGMSGWEPVEMMMLSAVKFTSSPV